MACAVTAWSPVIIRTSMPARSAISTAAFASARSGSMMPDHPDEARSRVSDIGSAVIAAVSSSSMSRAAKASTRRPFSPICRLAASMPARACSIGTWTPLSGPPAMRAPGEDDVGAALDQLDHVVGAVDLDPVERRHELVLGVERHLGQPRVGPPGLLGVDAELGGEHDERRLGRVADDRAVVGDGGVAVQHQAERQPGEVGHRRAGDRQ